MFRKSVHHDGRLCRSARVCVYITCDYRVRYVGDVLNAVCYVCVRSVYGVVVWCRDVSWCYVYVGYGDVLEVFCVYF